MSAHIVVFDSGVGGLSIVRELDQYINHYQLSYLFDNALFPYGELSEEVLCQRVLSLLVPFCQYHHPDLLVVACNTASTIVLEPLRRYLAIPVVGVVPAIKPAAQRSINKVIGLLATPATVKRRYTDQLITRFAPDCEVLRLGSSHLVQLAEQHLAGDLISATQLESILLPWLTLGARQPDTVILGCTHFPLIRDALQQVLGNSVYLVDSGQAVALRVLQLLKLHTAGCQSSTREAYYTKKNAHSEQLRASFEQFRFSQFTRLPDRLYAHWQDEPSACAAGILGH
ncbi:glutamate racemase [Celerinatantimonas yamalensis]|uniref:Glutamate racemase n=1 Tax=Celerinatantimonas yamalensis TaxID=559956 RepID=A0ABW9G9K7_9GAMM